MLLFQEIDNDLPDRELVEEVGIMQLVHSAGHRFLCALASMAGSD